jgi:hypothetical protein
LKQYKLQDGDQIPAELIQAGGEILNSKIHKLITRFYQEVPGLGQKRNADLT